MKRKIVNEQQVDSGRVKRIKTRSNSKFYIPNYEKFISIEEIENELEYNEMVDSILAKKVIIESNTKSKAKIGSTLTEDRVSKILNSVKNESKKTNEEFEHEREVYILKILRQIKRNSNELKNIYGKVVVKSKSFSWLDYSNLVGKYEKWKNFYMDNFNGLLCVSKDLVENKDSDSIHIYLELSRLHQILMYSSRRVTTMSLNVDRSISFFWYKSAIGKSRHIDREELLILNNLPYPRKASVMNLKFVHPSIILRFEKLKFGDNFPILQYSMENVMKSLMFLFHNIHIDFHLITNKKVRIHTIYFIELLLVRFGLLMTTFQLSENSDVPWMREKMMKNVDGNDLFCPNAQALKVGAQLFYTIRRMFNFDGISQLITGIFNAKEIIKMNKDDNDDVQTIFTEKKEEQSRPKKSPFQWNANENVQKISNFFIYFLRKRFGYHEEVLSPFFEEVLSEIIEIVLLPGLYEINKITESNVKDFWTRFVENTETKRDLVQQFMAETHEFITKFAQGFDEQLTDDLFGENRELIKKKSQKIFHDYVEIFMKSFFFSREAFEKAILNRNSLLGETISKRLKKLKLLQFQYMYAPNMLQNLFYLKAYKLWMWENFKYNDFINECVVLFYEIHQNNLEYYRKIRISQKHIPIIVFSTPTRCDILFNNKVYYCNHDIRNCFASWLLIIYFHCNGKLEKPDGSVNMKKEIERLMNIRVENKKEMEGIYKGFFSGTNDNSKKSSIPNMGFKFNPFNIISEKLSMRVEKPNFVAEGMNSLQAFERLEGLEKEIDRDSDGIIISNVSVTEIMNERERNSYNGINKNHWNENRFSMFNSSGK